MGGSLERIGLPEATFALRGLDPADNESRVVTAPDHTAAVGVLMDRLEERSKRDALSAVGHRVVHGGPRHSQPEPVTADLIDELRQLSQFDPEHLPEEISLSEAFQRRFPELPQVACFDTAFHHELPLVARLLPIPRRYEARGLRRYGLHGLSYAFLMAELARLDGLSWPIGMTMSAEFRGTSLLCRVTHSADRAVVLPMLRPRTLSTEHDPSTVTGMTSPTRTSEHSRFKRVATPSRQSCAESLPAAVPRSHDPVSRAEARALGFGVRTNPARWP